MGIITSIRPPLAVGEPQILAPVEARPTNAAPSGTSAPVTQTILIQAIQQSPGKAACDEARWMQARMTPETSAAAVAEAARDAYIKASIAAGISPLPLP